MVDFRGFAESGLANIELIEAQYEKYLRDPKSIDPTWRRFFESLGDAPGKTPPAPAHTKPTAQEASYAASVEREPLDIRVYNLIEAYRTYGHLMANVNPIKTHPLSEPPELQLKTHGLNQEDLSKQFPTYGLISEEQAPLSVLIDVLKSIYCGNIGLEYKGLGQPELELWLQNRIEPSRFKINLGIAQKQMILHQLNKSELLEVFLHTKYVGQKRFSLEGGETLIPMLSAAIETGAELGLVVFVIGMAHRGRLNVLSNILNKSYAELFSEFDESYIPESYEGSGDVKYHKGYSSSIETQNKRKVQIDLIPNPSHLESVDPVVEGQVRAKQDLLHDEKQEKVMPVLIHGDAAIAGQGVVYETLQLSRLKGYSTGGTLHFIINNQIGFTTIPQDGRSTHYCTDISKTFGSPVFHVNAEDPEGCVYATILATELRQKFHCDVFIDMYSYRKYGHNETDEPAFTQPLEYQIIRKKRPIREIYREELIRQSVLEKYMAEKMEEEFKKALQLALTSIKVSEKKGNRPEALDLDAHASEESLFKPIDTGVPKKVLQDAGECLCVVPSDFNIHPKLANLLKERLAMVSGDKPLDWGMGETLAYASLLWEGISIRISGQDCCRGTFSHRHALLMDQAKEREYYPLQHLKPAQGKFDIYNSPLSEYAVLGFELGYTLGNPEALVIWEAQFGDFANGAQLIIDQYLVSGEQKWAQKSDLVLFLPHGYEGQGPDHSTGRPERLLQMAGHENIRIVNPSTPAQLFHLLRRQVLNPVRKPLFVLTPKGLLRHPDCTNPIDDLIKGGFQEVLDDPINPSSPKRLIMCTGRIYYDLAAARLKSRSKDIVIVRIEQLYPLFLGKLKQLFNKYQGVTEYLWVQEEPENMGAWEFIRPLVAPLLPSGKTLKYIGRVRSATTAVGSHALHKQEHQEIMNAIFKGDDISIPANAAGLKS